MATKNKRNKKEMEKPNEREEKDEQKEEENEKTTLKKQEEDGFQLLAGSKLSYDQPANRENKRKRKAILEEESVTDAQAEERTRKHEEDVHRLRKINRIFTWGSNIPDPLSDFLSLPLPDCLRENLQHFLEPTPVQMQAIPVALSHRDHLVTAPTGSGKTLAFAIPVIVHTLHRRQAESSHRLSAVVLEPTKVLAKQTFDNFEKFCNELDINCGYLREAGIDEQCDILIATPNRLIFALEKFGSDERSAKLLEGLHWLIVDECDRMFERTEGEASFRVQLSKILRLCNGKDTRRGFYSATFSYEVEDWCKEHLRNVAMVCIGARNSANEMVQQELLFAGWEQAKISAVRDIVRHGFDPPALIFLQSKDRAKQLYMELHEYCKEIPIGLISGDLKENECELVLQRFLSGQIWLLICTELLGRGLDFQNVNLVINFDLPTSIVSYIHRIGRTGRAGRIGRAITLFTEADMPIIRPIATVIHQAGFPIPEYLFRLNKPSKTNRNKMKRMAPHRKNLLPGWSRLKYKVKLDVEKNLMGKKEGKQKKKRKVKRKMEKGSKEKEEENSRGSKKAEKEKGRAKEGNGRQRWMASSWPKKSKKEEKGCEHEGDRTEGFKSKACKTDRIIKYLF